MAYSTPFTAVAGTAWKAADWNVYGRDNIAWIATDSPACRAYNNAAISHTTSGSSQAVTMNSERFDNAGIHSTSSNTDRLTIPAGAAGKYICWGALAWANSASGTYRQAQLKVNGSTVIASCNQAPSASHGSDSTVAAVYSLAAADYVTLNGAQDSGGALNMVSVANYSPEAAVFWFRN